VAIGVGAVFSGGSFVLGESADSYSQVLTERFNAGAQYEGLFDPILNAAALVWQKAIQPYLHHLGLLALGLYLACVALGTVCYRYAVNRS
jgi:hypothetical protein